MENPQIEEFARKILMLDNNGNSLSEHYCGILSKGLNGKKANKNMSVLVIG